MLNETIREGGNSSQKNSETQSLADLKGKFNPIRARHLQQERSEIENPRKIENLNDFYDAINNPIDDDTVLISIINAYANSGEVGSGLYGALQKIYTGDEKSETVNPEDRQRFEKKMYARWRHSVVDITDEELQSAKNAGILGSDFKGLRDFVKSHPECSTGRELERAIEKEAKNPNKAFAVFDKYNWKSEQGLTFQHVSTHRVSIRRKNEGPIDHRFYLNTDSTSTYAIADALVDFYEKNQIPYYFKFDDKGTRDDTIVIYASTKELVNNLKVLRQLKKERPDLAEHLYTPPILTGVIDGDIGYGAEPPEKSSHSYNTLRAEILESALNEATRDWVSTHQNDTVRYNDKEISFSEYVVEKMMKKLKKSLNHQFEFWSSALSSHQQKKDGAIDKNQILEETAKKLGFNLQDLQSGSMMSKFFRASLNKYFPNIIESFRTTGKNYFIARLRGDAVTNLASPLADVLREITPKIASYDKSYLEDVRKRIYEKCAKNGINPDKFVFDETTLKKMHIGLIS